MARITVFLPASAEYSLDSRTYQICQHGAMDRPDPSMNCFCSIAPANHIALRFYNPDILAKLAAGEKIGTGDREYIRDHLRKNDLEIEKFMRRKVPDALSQHP